MRTTSYILCWMLLLGLGVESASARVITVSVTAHVAYWYDPGNALGGQVANGTPVTGTYTYDTNTSPQGYPTSGQYVLAPPSGNVSVSVGTLTFHSLPGQQSQTVVSVHPSLPPGGQNSNLQIQSYNDQVLLQYGAVNAQISFLLTDTTGQWPASNLLPTGAPAIQNFIYSVISFGSVGAPAATTFNVAAQIDSVQLVPSQLEVSPESGSFAVGQRFDAALVLPAGAAGVVNIQANATAPAPAPANGIGIPPQLLYVPFTYPGQCQHAPATSTGRPVMLCLYADQILNGLAAVAQVPGPLTINLQVGLADGTFLYQTVVWNLIQ